MIKLLKKYGVELKLKKCDLFRLIEGQKDTFLEDGLLLKWQMKKKCLNMKWF